MLQLIHNFIIGKDKGFPWPNSRGGSGGKRLTVPLA